MKKQLITAGIVAAVGTAGVVGSGVANAQSGTTSTTNPMSSLVDAVASKFNLNKADVQKVFDEQRTQLEAEREQEIKDELAQLVRDGKLTQAQVDKITAKRAEMKQEREAARSNTSQSRETMKKELDANRSELETWAKDNGIATKYLHFVIGGGHHGGPRGDTQTDSTNSSATDQ